MTESSDHGDILIIGGGIGGLVTALSLHEAGFGVQVFEAVPVIRPLGVGINLLPHAVRELDELALQEALEVTGIRCRELAYFTRRGVRIWAEPRGIEAGYHWPQISIHRGRLQQVLLDAAIARVGSRRIHCGQQLKSFDIDTDDRVRATFVDRTQDAEQVVEGRLLIGADGIHSAVRRQLFSEEGPPRWNGAIMWRGVADAPAMFDGRTMIMAGHSEQKFVCYPIRWRSGRDDLQEINFVAELRFDSQQPLEQQDWNRTGRLEDFLPAFEGWHFDWLDVPELIRAAEKVWVYPMVDRDPLPRWSHGPVTLLGDAAHPMYPIGSNGASQAILDARVLTGCLRYYSDNLNHGLARYDDIRRASTSAIVLANRGQGPEAVMQIVEDRAPEGFDRLEDIISQSELESTAEQYKKLAGFSVSELNERPSLVEPTP